VLSIAERVAAGAAWLDEHRPGWVERVNLDTLDLGDSCECVLGQEYGDFWKAPTEVIFEDYVRGFNRSSSRDDSSAYEPLTAAWRVLIEARRSTPTGAPA
jgi:hypothetical protein